MVRLGYTGGVGVVQVADKWEQVVHRNVDAKVHGLKFMDLFLAFLVFSVREVFLVDSPTPFDDRSSTI